MTTIKTIISVTVVILLILLTIFVIATRNKTANMIINWFEKHIFNKL